MPPPDIYEAEIAAWPWRQLVSYVAKVVAEHVPPNGVVLDYMCGTGLLFREIRAKRSDALLIGCDSSPEYIEYAAGLLPSAEWHLGDARVWRPQIIPDIIICSAGIHHLPANDHSAFIRKIHGELSPQGIFIIGEELLPPFANKVMRVQSIQRLYTDIFEYLINNKPSREAISASIDVMLNDALERGEHKLTKSALEALVREKFYIKEWAWLWPTPNVGYGDVCVICQPTL